MIQGGTMLQKLYKWYARLSPREKFLYTVTFLYGVSVCGLTIAVGIMTPSKEHVGDAIITFLASGSVFGMLWISTLIVGDISHPEWNNR